MPIIALTATANSRTVDDIKIQLRLHNCATFIQSFNRSNLHYRILPKPGPKKAIDEISDFVFQNHRNKTGIVYCTGRDKTEEVARLLREKGHRATHYHAKINDDDRKRTFEDWISNRVSIIVATVRIVVFFETYRFFSCSSSRLRSAWESTKPMVIRMHSRSYAFF